MIVKQGIDDVCGSFDLFLLKFLKVLYPFVNIIVDSAFILPLPVLYLIEILLALVNDVTVPYGWHLIVLFPCSVISIQQQSYQSPKVVWLPLFPTLDRDKLMFFIALVMRCLGPIWSFVKAWFTNVEVFAGQATVPDAIWIFFTANPTGIVVIKWLWLRNFLGLVCLFYFFIRWLLYFVCLLFLVLARTSGLFHSLGELRLCGFDEESNFLIVQHSLKGFSRVNWKYSCLFIRHVFELTVFRYVWKKFA